MMESKYLLAIETATDQCSVAVSRPDHVVAEISVSRPRVHAENLVPMIQDALRLAAIKSDDVSVVAVSMGPGSYTGLRIGVSTAKGLAFAGGAALVGVPSLPAIARSVRPMAAAGDLIAAAFNSRKDEVYLAVFEAIGCEELIVRTEASAVLVYDEDIWRNLDATRRLWLVGEGGDRLSASAGHQFAEVIRLDPDVFRPSAGWIARLAWEQFNRGETDELVTFEPFYLKEFVAKKPSGSIFDRLPF